MVAPVVAAAIPVVLEMGASLIDRLFPDKTEAAAHKVRLIELAQQGQLEELERWVDQLRVEMEDRASARQREAQTGDTRTPQLLAATMVIGFFGVLAWLLSAGMPKSGGGEALLVLLGALSTGMASVLSYYFGSSSGSQYKSRLLQQEQERQP